MEVADEGAVGLDLVVSKIFAVVVAIAAPGLTVCDEGTDMVAFTPASIAFATTVADIPASTVAPISGVPSAAGIERPEAQAITSNTRTIALTSGIVLGIFIKARLQVYRNRR